MFQNLNYNLHKISFDVLPDQQSYQSMYYSDALAHADVRYHIFHDYSSIV